MTSGRVIRTGYRSIGALTLATTVATAWLGGTALAVPAVSITNFAYQPSSVSVTAGTAVTWTNDDPAPHSVTADDGTFDSGPTCSPTKPGPCLATGATFTHAFSAAGTYAYHCRVHSFMHGMVIVTAATTTTTPSSSTTTPSTTTTPSPTTAVPTTTTPTTASSVTTVVVSPTGPTTTAPAGAPAAVSATHIVSSPPTRTLPMTGAGVALPLALGGLLLTAAGILLGALTRRRVARGR